MRDFEAHIAQPEWEARHRVFRKPFLAALSLRLLLTRQPAYADFAFLGAVAGVVAGGHIRRTAGAALEALGYRAEPLAILRFVWEWWYQRAATGTLAYQGDRASPAWITRNVEFSGELPSGGCVLISAHHFGQELAFARLGTLIHELGVVSTFEQLPDGHPLWDEPPARLLSIRQRVGSWSRFARRVFGPRTFLPSVAARRGLELLQRGGSLIVLADFFGQTPGCVLGKQLFLPAGVVWWAQQTQRPIVPFMLEPSGTRGSPWRLWCGTPIEPTMPAVIQAVEDCIRRSPTLWRGWPAWAAAPACTGIPPV